MLLNYGFTHNYSYKRNIKGLHKQKNFLFTICQANFISFGKCPRPALFLQAAPESRVKITI